MKDETQRPNCDVLTNRHALTPLALRENATSTLDYSINDGLTAPNGPLVRYREVLDHLQVLRVDTCQRTMHV